MTRVTAPWDCTCHLLSENADEDVRCPRCCFDQATGFDTIFDGEHDGPEYRQAEAADYQDGRMPRGALRSMGEAELDQAADYVREMGGGVSFAQLRRFVEDSLGMDSRGEWALDVGLNVVVWAGMSRAFLDFAMALRQTGRVEFTPTQPLVYLADGEFLTLPLAKNPPKKGYKEPHWAPVTIHPPKTRSDNR